MIKKIYGYWLSVLTFLFGIDLAKQFDAYFRFKRKLNLKNPQTLADKVTYLFLHRSTPLMSSCTDKWAVREYVKGKGLADILVPVVGGSWTNVEGINFDALPNKFILKATHGCKMNYIVENKAELDISDCKNKLQKWLDTTYGTYSLEPHYKLIPHRIYAEELLDDPHQIIDYKINCLNGKPKFIFVGSERDSSQKSMKVKWDLFDTKWNCINQYLRTTGLETPNLGKIPIPKHFKEMLSAAEILSADFAFVRVDLYEVKGKVYFGELTFSPACGVMAFFTDEFISKMGKELEI